MGNASQVRRLREHPSAAARSPFSNGEGKEEAASPPKKEANPASLHSAAPSKGRGSRGYSLLPLEGGAPKGRRLDGGKRYERERGRSSQVRRLREYPIHRCAVPLPQWGRLRNENTVPPAKPSRVGKVASRASRIGFWRYEREGESSKVDDSRKHSLQKQLIKPIYSYKKRKSNAANDFNVICRSGYRYMREKSEAVHFYD